MVSVVVFSKYRLVARERKKALSHFPTCKFPCTNPPTSAWEGVSGFADVISRRDRRGFDEPINGQISPVALEGWRSAGLIFRWDEVGLGCR